MGSRTDKSIQGFFLSPRNSCWWLCQRRTSVRKSFGPAEFSMTIFHQKKKTTGIKSLALKRSTFLFSLSFFLIFFSVDSKNRTSNFFWKKKKETLKQCYTSEDVLSLSEENVRPDDVEAGVFALTQMEEKHPQQYHHMVQGSHCGKIESQRECIAEGVHVSCVNSLSACGKEKEVY